MRCVKCNRYCPIADSPIYDLCSECYSFCNICNKAVGNTVRAENNWNGKRACEECFVKTIVIGLHYKYSWEEIQAYK